MKNFLDENFLLQSAVAEYLYYEHAKKMPIIDYHCHLIPQQIAEDKVFENITQPWLYGDHYKWRAMRTNGVNEHFCTGNASDYEKFQKWAETVPYTIRNPLFHWTHLELKTYFGINEILNTASAKRIYEKTSALLNSKEYSVRSLLGKMKVEVICTTDDPVDSLEYHQQIKADGFPIKVLPAWRPDKAMTVENTDSFNNYLDALSEISGIDINNYNSLLEALRKRHIFFHNNGCRLSDHGIENFFAENYTEADIRDIFGKVRTGKNLDYNEIVKFKSAMLYEFAIMDHEKGWSQQFHIGAMRNNNARLLNILGPDTGFDSIGDYSIAGPMSRFLDRLDIDNKLTKTILYNLNPAHNEVMATMLGNFHDGTAPGKMQWGSAWWFLDQKDGMEQQMNALSTLGLLSRFVGMLTDSRSYLSFPRHEYFRRILCNLLGNDVVHGEIPYDKELLGTMVENICYYNARNYFGFYQ
jgi:glucuronate isomerase